MKALPQQFRDTLTLVTVLAILAFLAWVVSRNDLSDAVMVIVGSLLVILGNIYQFYYRKAGPDGAGK